jgi:hypothetical protein
MVRGSDKGKSMWFYGTRNETTARAGARPRANAFRATRAYLAFGHLARSRWQLRRLSLFRNLCSGSGQVSG